jgi:sulfur carrier protein ThiS
LKRKTRRTGQKKLKAFYPPLVIIIAIVFPAYFFFKDSTIPVLESQIQSWFLLQNGSNWAPIILFGFLILIIVLFTLVIGRYILIINKPTSKEYFELIDFEKPTDTVIKKATEGILYSEKTQPCFVHVAPVNDEIELFNEMLYEDGFIWENGKPGEGKTMLAYHALHGYRKRIGFSYKYSIKLPFLKYIVYKLNLNHIKDEKEIDLIINELDGLKGGKRKIILVDDAHRLNFEDKLRTEFEEEAKEKLNGKFCWINTNYLDQSNSASTYSFNIDFEKLYPKLIDGFYKSQNLIVKGIIEEKCSGLHNAIQLKEKGKINDPWHFNFVASNGEKRIYELLKKLSGKTAEQNVLFLAVFFFSVRNIMTGEKEISHLEFTNLLSEIDITDFKSSIEAYTPKSIISDLGRQAKGRFIIIDNRDSINRGFLKASHYKMSMAIVKSITEIIDDEYLVKKLIDTTKLLLTNDSSDCKYFNVYFDLLGDYQNYFLDNNKDWIKSFLIQPNLDQLHVYPTLLSTLKKHHNLFYKGLTTDAYFVTIASVISLAPANRFNAIQLFVRVLGKEKFVQELNLETLAKAANKAEVPQLTQVADFINALGKNKEKFVQELNLETLAKAANKAEVSNFGQLEAILNALGKNKEKFVQELNLETLAKAANKAEVPQLTQVSDFINALGKNKEKFVQELNLETLAKAANKAEATQLKQVADFINALNENGFEFAASLDLNSIFNWSLDINHKELNSFCLIVSRIDEETRDNIVDKIDWSNLLNKLNINHRYQIRTLSNILGFQNRKYDLIPNDEDKNRVATYLTKNQDEIIRFATLHFTAPYDFQSVAYLLFYIPVYSIELSNEIVSNLHSKMITRFEILPKYFKSFSNLLNSINQINSTISENIISNESVKSKLQTSLMDTSVNEQLVGLQNLLKTINTINSSEAKELLELESVKVLNLDEIETNSDNESLNGI